jgi:hypothetical protein
MEVMTNHKWQDPDVESVEYDPGGGQHSETRSIMFAHTFTGELLISKDDVIALAKEFGLVVYEEESRL